MHFELGRRSKRSFPELIQVAAAMISTSVAEGFGLAFLEPWLAGKPLTGRDIPEITADFKKNGVVLDLLYPRLDIPLAWLDSGRLRACLEHELRALRLAYERPCTAGDIQAAWDAMVCDDQVDFGCLDEPLQEQVIDAVRRDPGKARALTFPGCGDERMAHNAERIEACYHVAAYGKRLEKLYRTTAASAGGAGDALNSEILLDHFTAPERFRLLRT